MSPLQRYLLLLVLVPLLGACRSERGTGQVVVDTSDSASIDQIELALAAGAGTTTVRFPATPAGALTFPRKVAVTFPRDRTGLLSAEVTGLWQGQAMLRGSATAPLQPNLVTLTVSLTPLLPGNDGDAGTPDGDMRDPPDLPDLTPTPDLSPTCLPLNGDWQPTMDVGDSPIPAVVVQAASATEVTVLASGQGAQGTCGCNAQTLRLDLGRSYSCASSTLVFGYTTSGSFSANNQTALLIRLLQGSAPVGFVTRSAQTGFSQCAIALPGSNYPTPPRLGGGSERIALGQLDERLDGRCSGTFDTLEIHLQARACTSADTSTTTLSSLCIE